jgi:hypothetical protein
MDPLFLSFTMNYYNYQNINIKTRKLYYSLIWTTTLTVNKDNNMDFMIF